MLFVPHASSLLTSGSLGLELCCIEGHWAFLPQFRQIALSETTGSPQGKIEIKRNAEIHPDETTDEAKLRMINELHKLYH